MIKINEGVLNVERTSETKDHKSKHGLYRALINNMVIGVSEGWTKELELVGVGYRASAQGQKLELALGFSHNVVMSLAQEVKVETVSEKGANPIIKLSSYDKQVKPGRILFEVGGVPLDIAKEALRLAAQKLPVKTKFIIANDYELV